MMVDQLNSGIHQPIQRRALGRLGGRAIEQVVAGDARLVLGWCLAERTRSAVLVLTGFIPKMMNIA